MNKTYHRRVFGGKDADFRGIDQGKGSLYPNALEMSLNATFDDNVFKTRLGQISVDYGTTGVILCAKQTPTYVTIMAGTEVYILEWHGVPSRVPRRLADSEGNPLYDMNGIALFAFGE